MRTSRGSIKHSILFENEQALVAVCMVAGGPLACNRPGRIAPILRCISPPGGLLLLVGRRPLTVRPSNARKPSVRNSPLKKLMLLCVCLLPAALGCQQWNNRMENLRDERVGEIEQNLGYGYDGRDSARSQAMPELSDSNR